MEQVATSNESRTRSRTQGFLKEILIIAFGYFVYSQVRGLAADRVVDAFSNGHRIVQFEQNLGIFKELALQTYLWPHSFIIETFNYIYFYGLFPLLLPTAGWLFFFRPRVYTLARNSFLISGGIAVLFFLLLPTAPPRLLGVGFIDTLTLSFTPSYNSIPGVNHFAALPSMHVGWSFLTAMAIFLSFPGFRFRWLILLLPVSMFTATVVTGNHYFLDGVLGAIVSGSSFFISTRIQSWTDRRAAVREATAVIAEEPSALETQAPSLP